MFSYREAHFAIEAVREASLLARRVQRDLVTAALTKGDRSPVTVADFAAQALVARRLAESLPGSVLIGEEHAGALRTDDGRATLEQVTRFVGDYLPGVTPDEVCELIDRGSGDPPGEFWTLDPVDGTKGFLRGDQYAVALGWIRDGQVELGVLGCPELADAYRPEPGGPGSLIVAAVGRGAWSQPLEIGDRRQASSCKWNRLTVSERSQTATARLLRSVESAHTSTGGITRLVEQLDIGADPVRMDSQAKYAVLAAGRAEALVRLLSPSQPDYREKIWDQAAGSLVVTEAGGRVTDLDGRPLDFSRGRTLAANRGVLATNCHLHDAILAGLAAIGA
jgi:HAL2 family 3'(2'),5'-bisphosphate nucleotidase